MGKIFLILLSALSLSLTAYAQTGDENFDVDAKWHGGDKPGDDEGKKDKEKDHRDHRGEHKKKWKDHDNGETCHPGEHPGHGHGHHGNPGDHGDHHHKPKKKEHRQTYTCRAVDANHVVFAWESGRDRDYVERIVLSRCHAKSAVPRTCRILSCTSN